MKILFLFSLKYYCIIYNQLIYFKIIINIYINTNNVINFIIYNYEFDFK